MTTRIKKKPMSDEQREHVRKIRRLRRRRRRLELEEFRAKMRGALGLAA
jgi:hypothetical protein